MICLIAATRWLVACAIAFAGVAQAQAQQPNPANPASPNAAAAEEAFRNGRELAKADRFAEACVQFEKSQRLEPAYGTLLNIAQCSAKIGKLATAAAAYREIVAKDTNDQRKATATDQLKVITPRIAKLLVKVDSPPAGVIVELDSKAGLRTISANQPVETDFGDYTIVVRARGHSEFISRVKVNQEAKTTTVEATLVSNTAVIQPVSTEPEEPVEPVPPRSKRKLFGIGAIATGGTVLVTGVVFGALARNQWSEAKAVCGGTVCMTQEDFNRADDLRDKAGTKATVSTVLVIGGLAIAGAGAVLLITAPRETTLAPVVSDSGAGVTLSGRF
jgi:hypothetical protein